MTRRISVCFLPLLLVSTIGVAPAGAHGLHEGDRLDIPESAPDAGDVRWLAGDHHIHSRYSTSYDTDKDPPEPKVGGDAIYPIPMNALMARKFGLSWMVATDHGGPNHSKVNHDRAYPELLLSRELVPDVVQFFGMELNSPAADHSSIIIPAGSDEADRLQELELAFDAREAWPEDPARNTEPKMLEALRAAQKQSKKPVVIAHHPSRSATGMGEYGMTTPRELRSWNDTAPDIAVGMEGAPGHQASGEGGQASEAYARYFGTSQIMRGAYTKFPTMGGFDQMTARLGGFWDSMLGEGRRWWITANSDSHIHWSEGGMDYWPGEYSKTYVHARKAPQEILEAIRAGKAFVTTGDLVSGVEILNGKTPVELGGTIEAKRGETLHLTIRFRDPDGNNAKGQNPTVRRVDLIRGTVTGKAGNPDQDRNPTARIESRFTADDWRKDGEWVTIETELPPIEGNAYIRLRGTNTSEAEPAPDTPGEDVWSDLWFYTNPVFIVTR
ncbi:MAG: phosphoesterase [Novosphingobium sp.]|nr:phosphoesterase [Novosphingobium sp.]